ncbi:hypothetical protein Ancab_023556 [Ancistrocladus abbreviatus]
MAAARFLHHLCKNSFSSTCHFSLLRFNTAFKCSFTSLSASRKSLRHPYKEPSQQQIPSLSSFSSIEHWGRRIQTHSVMANQEKEDAEKNEVCSSPDITEVEVHSQSRTDDDDAVKCSATSNLKVSSRHDLAMIFTCKVCETRSIKTVCRESYEKGIVVVRCGGCNNLHLIADHLGWFGDPGSIEDLLAARGEEVKKGAVDSLNLTLEDLGGKKL